MGGPSSISLVWNRGKMVTQMELKPHCIMILSDLYLYIKL